MASGHNETGSQRNRSILSHALLNKQEKGEMEKKLTLCHRK